MTGRTLATRARPTVQRILTVADAMHTHPKLCDAAATVGDLRRFLAEEHVHAALIVDHHVLLAVIDRSDLSTLRTIAPEATEPADGWSALSLGTLTGRIVRDTTNLVTAHRIMTANHRRRLAVIDADGRCVGLLCLKRSGAGFCSDIDVSSRRRERR